MHPELARAHVTAWENHHICEDTRAAVLRLTIAQAGGMKRKNGRALTLDDFLPDYCKTKRKPKPIKEQELYLKAAFAEFVKPPQSNG